MLRPMTAPTPGDRTPRQGSARSRHRLPWPFAAVGGAAAIVAALFDPGDARSAAAQDWSPFVLVSGLLLIGLVADDDGLFAAAGHRLARTSRNGVALFAGASVLVGATTALLNLDTSVPSSPPYSFTRLGVAQNPRPRSCMRASCCPTPDHCSFPAPTSRTSSSWATYTSRAPASSPTCGYRR